jgi:hypothetical protein
MDSSIERARREVQSAFAHAQQWAEQSDERSFHGSERAMASRSTRMA